MTFFSGEGGGGDESRLLKLARVGITFVLIISSQFQSDKIALGPFLVLCDVYILVMYHIGLFFSRLSLFI